MLGIFKSQSNNFYLEPKTKWTPYYIGMCRGDAKQVVFTTPDNSEPKISKSSNQQPSKTPCPRQKIINGLSALELILGSVNYTTHNIKYLSQMLNISITTIYKYLKSLIKNNVIDRTKELINPIKLKRTFSYTNHSQNSYKPIFRYRYHNTLRSVYTEFNNMLRESKNQNAYYQAILKKQSNPRKTNNNLSRKWHVGLLGHFTTKYKLKLNNNLLLNIQPSQATQIISRLEEKYGQDLNARIIHWGLVKNATNQIA